MLLFIVKLIGFLLVSELFLKINSEIKFNANLHKVQESGSNCVLKIIENFFPEGSIVCVISSGLKNAVNKNSSITTEQIILQQLMYQSRWTIMMKIGSDSVAPRDANAIEKVHNYIMFVKTIEDLQYILKTLKRTSSWNPHAQFLMYVENGIETVDRDPLMSRFLELCWKYWIINLTILLPDVDLFIHRILTYFPFDEGNCGAQKIKYVELGICDASLLIPEDNHYFPHKVPNNLNHCPVKIVTVFWPPFVIQPKERKFGEEYLTMTEGIEIEIMDTIAKKANFTPKYKSFDVPENWGVIYSNKTGSGMMGMLLDNEVDIAIGTLTPTIENHKNFDFTIQYMQVNIIR